MTPAHKCERKLIAKLTRTWYRVPYFVLTCPPSHALPHHVFRRGGGGGGQGAQSVMFMSRKEFALAFVCWPHFNLLHRADEPQKGRNSCPRLQSYFIGFFRVGVSQSQLFYVVYQPCGFACILVIFLADKDSSRSYVSLQHYLWRSFAYFTSTLRDKSGVFRTSICPPGLRLKLEPADYSGI